MSTEFRQSNISGRSWSRRMSFEGIVCWTTNAVFKLMIISGTLVWSWIKTVVSAATVIDLMPRPDTFTIGQAV